MFVHVTLFLIGQTCDVLCSYMTCPDLLQHEVEIRVLLPSAAVEVAMVGGVGDVVSSHAQPQQAPQHHKGAPLVTLDAPAT